MKCGHPLGASRQADQQVALTSFRNERALRWRGAREKIRQKSRPHTLVRVRAIASARIEFTTPTNQRAAQVLLATTVIPFAAVDERLQWCLEGLADAAAGRLEVILVRNGRSTDEHDGQVRAWLRLFGLDGRVLAVDRPDVPYALSSARNLGFRNASTELVICLDADCVPSDSWLDGYLSVFSALGHSLVVIAGERRFVALPASRKPQLSVAEQLRSAPCLNSLANHRRAVDQRRDRFPLLPNVEPAWDLMHGGNVATTRTAWRESGGFNTAFDGSWGFEDLEFASRVLTLPGCVPAHSRGSYVYHLESASDIERPRRDVNPNWRLACDLIPGFEEFKLRQYRDLDEK